MGEAKRRLIGRLGALSITQIAAAVSAAGTELKNNYKEEKVKLEGKALSKARLIKEWKDVPALAAACLKVEGPPQPIEGAVVRTSDGKPMQYFSDGSLRHAFGRRLMKAERRALKRAKRVKR